MTKIPARPDERFLVTEEQIGERVDFQAIFGNTRPVEVEIGSGKGALLVHIARERPECNFLGVEWASRFYRFTADRIRRWGLTHVRMLRTDARELVLRKIPPVSVSAFHVYFPDPWPKKRHHKRRFFIPEVCRALALALVPGGKIYVATDHEEYFDQMETNLLAVKGFVRSEFDSPAGNEVLSNYESKFVKEGRSIYRLAIKKTV